VQALGRLGLTKLTAQHIQRLWGEKLECGSSPMTVRHLHAVLHKALEDALRLNLVQRNVADLVSLPRIAKHEMKALAPDQARALLDAARGDRLEALYAVAVYTGMRQGELLALRWSDVDFERKHLQVRATLQAIPGGGFEFAEPKTKGSRRKITLPQGAIKALREHRVRQKEERLALGEAWEDLDLVFPNPIGRPMDASNLLRRQFYPLLEKVGLPRIRFHDLRHTAATLMLTGGVQVKAVSEMLGHSSVNITLETYSHVLPGIHQQAAATMDAILGSA
jgi:integrase